ncbi:MAG TPA: heme-binding protein [Caulobacteraceae bacterium]|jgi:uncharacterized protein GlcG (DUF336 family)|nr:heme-binding protein [Caulobacteraceae bacterium]
MAGTVLLAAAPATVHADTPVVLPLSAKQALKAAEAALSTCSAAGLHVSVSIVDREGVARVLVVGDGAGPISVSTSRRKAYTAAALGVRTSDLAARMAANTGATAPQTIDPEVLVLAGGVPIRRGDTVIAAVGVGGADQSDKDQACAQAGVDSLKDELH